MYSPKNIAGEYNTVINAPSDVRHYAVRRTKPIWWWSTLGLYLLSDSDRWQNKLVVVIRIL